MSSSSEEKPSSFYIEDLPSNIDESLLKSHISSKIKFLSLTLTPTTDNKSIAKVDYLISDIKDISILEELDDTEIPNTNTKIKIKYSKPNENTSSTVLTHNIKTSTFKLGEEIIYNIPYHEHIDTHFARSKGDEYLIFIDNDTIEKQRNVINHFITKIGSNILSGSGIMNVSLPINIFDQRSLIEVFAHQCRLTPYFFEKAGEEEDEFERLKLLTAFAISRIHLSVTQLKPFNPIWGETFQAKIGDTKLYLEQSSHHPPIYHFYQVGKNFKSFGYQMPEASTGPNHIKAWTLGKYFIQFKDGQKYLIYPCDLEMTGTLFGDRTYQIKGQFYVVNLSGDFMSYIEFNPETRGFFGKMFNKKNTFPDFYSGFIAKKDQFDYDEKNDKYSPKDNVTKLNQFSGEWSHNCLVDEEEVYWEKDDEKFKLFPLERMEYTLQSDSSVREDCLYLKEGNEDMADKAKIEMEEIQRRDRK